MTRIHLLMIVPVLQLTCAIFSKEDNNNLLGVCNTFTKYTLSPLADSSKHDTLKQCCFNVGTASATVAKHKTSLFERVVFAR